MAGGDGSQATVASVAMEHDVAHVCVPAGRATTLPSISGSTGTMSLGLSMLFTDGVERRIDLASVNGRIFVNNASIGLYARSCKRPPIAMPRSGPGGKLPEMLGPDASSIDVQFQGPTPERGPTPQSFLSRIILIS